MFFIHIPHTKYLPNNLLNRAILVDDNWDDWFEFQTTFILHYCDEVGNWTRIGEVKIGQFGVENSSASSNFYRPKIPKEFESLPEEFFSLGQDVAYYESLNQISLEIKDKILVGLRDMALDNDLFEKALEEKVTGQSLLRSVSRQSVSGQLHRVANGGARLTNYSFAFSVAPTENENSVRFMFEVYPESTPPTNIHVLIGRNGVGKTHHLNLMTEALVFDSKENKGKFSRNSDNVNFHEGRFNEKIFDTIVSVTFSAFDPFDPIKIDKDNSKGVRYHYIGLKDIGDSNSSKSIRPKSPNDLAEEFLESIKLISNQAVKLNRWKNSLKILESDPVFESMELLSSIKLNNEMKRWDRLINKFNRMSSGHKIVLLTITRLVELVEERTLAIIDEPEAHLHPPLLSAFIRALSDLLFDRNGVAIIATHSPVVLQEVPRYCVWKIRRSGLYTEIERPEIETFAENVSVLTREVFGLEVTESGFHSMLVKSVRTGRSYEAILDEYQGQMGQEGRAILRQLIARRDREMNK